MSLITEGKSLGVLERFERWALSHLSFLILATIVVLGMSALLLGFHFWSNSSESKAQKLLYELSKTDGELTEVMRKFPKSNAALLAAVQDAVGELKTKNYDACVTNYETAYERARREPFFRVLALHGVGTCLRFKGDFKKSAETFERAAKEPGHVDPSLSRFESIVSLELDGDPTAKEKYQELLRSSMNPQLKQKVEEKWLQLSIEN